MRYTNGAKQVYMDKLLFHSTNEGEDIVSWNDEIGFTEGETQQVDNIKKTGESVLDEVISDTVDSNSSDDISASLEEISDALGFCI